MESVLPSDDAAHELLTALGPLSSGVWSLTMRNLIYDPLAGPEESAVRRGIIACVCKAWMGALYADPTLWSRITIVKAMPISALDFVLSRCTNGGVHVRISLLDVRRVGDQPATINSIKAWVDSVFDRLSRISDRWSSLCLDTDHPFIFACIRSRCLAIRAHSPESSGVSYPHLPVLLLSENPHRILRSQVYVLRVEQHTP
ncbi:hypothetical protein DFH06DRAFT_1407110 [Mycena polygramma]|nr:hypothetical protein DFH06DRAFT_1407110 [Mycena polygramma]